MITPFTPGSPVDVAARLLAQHLSTLLGQQVIVDNRPGAGTTTGMKAAALAEPDGYTLLYQSSSLVVAPAMYKNLDYDPVKAFAPIAYVAGSDWVTVVPPSLPVRTMPEFIAYAKANPGKLNYGSAGAGTTHHLAGELFKILTKTNIQHVPYRGAGPAMQDLIAGHVPVVFDGLGSSAAPVRAGQLRALAVAAPKRVPAFPDLPTAAEAGLAGYEVSTWYGLFAPKNTPPAIVAQMIKELQKAMQTPAIKEAWERNGSDVPDVAGPAFAKMVSAEVERWRKVVTDANVKLD